MEPHCWSSYRNWESNPPSPAMRLPRPRLLSPHATARSHSKCFPHLFQFNSSRSYACSRSATYPSCVLAIRLPALMVYLSSIRPGQQDSLLYTQFSRTHQSSISSSIHSIHCGIYLSLYLNIFMCDLVLKDLLRRI
jgi:hypothetical protein